MYPQLIADVACLIANAPGTCLGWHYTIPWHSLLRSCVGLLNAISLVLMQERERTSKFLPPTFKEKLINFLRVFKSSKVPT